MNEKTCTWKRDRLFQNAPRATNDVKTKLPEFMIQSKSLYYFPSDAASPSFVFALCLAL